MVGMKANLFGIFGPDAQQNVAHSDSVSYQLQLPSAFNPDLNREAVGHLAGQQSLLVPPNYAGHLAGQQLHPVTPKRAGHLAGQQSRLVTLGIWLAYSHAQ